MPRRSATRASLAATWLARRGPAPSPSVRADVARAVVATPRRLAVVLVAIACVLGVVPGVTSAAPATRVVVLAPSATETVYALGAGDRVVGVCGQCDFPPAAARATKVGGYLTPSVES